MKRLVRFPEHGRAIRVDAGTSLIEAVRKAGLPIARACDGAGLCGRCGVRIVEGAAGLAAEAPDETRTKRRNRVDSEQRLACRVRVEADLAVSANYW